MNSIHLLGNLTADPVLRHIGSGTAVCDLRIANNNKQGGKEETLFISVTVWGKQAELCSQYLKKGRQVIVEGRLRMETWGEDDDKKTKYVIVANNVTFLGGGKTQEVDVNSSSSDDVPF